MVWNYRELLTRVYRIDVRASHYKTNPPLLITMSDYTGNYRLSLPRATICRNKFH